MGRQAGLRTVALLSVLSIVAACGSQVPTQSASVPSEPAASGVPIDSGPAAQPPTSEEKIAQAFAAGTIDRETSLRYRAYALYADERLPEAYRSPVIDIEAGGRLAGEVLASESELSQATLDELHPFLARPNDPESVFSKAETGSTGPNDAVLASARRPATGGRQPEAAQADWMSDLTTQGAVRVWARLPDTPEGRIELDAYIGIVDQIWEKLPAFIQEPNPDDGDDPTSPNPDSAVDIYVVSFEDVDTRRQRCDYTRPNRAACYLASNSLGEARPTRPKEGASSSGYVLVQSGLTGDLLKGTLAHEIFHVCQFSYDYNETSWLEESTAT